MSSVLRGEVMMVTRGDIPDGTGPGHMDRITGLRQ